MISETAVSFQAPARKDSKTFTIQIEPLLSLYGDEENIRKLVSILLDNALKYSDENGRIQLTLEKKGKHVQLTVSNTTQDKLNKEQLTHLFDRFYRMDASRNSETGGYGIGLSIAQAVVQMHKGTISVTAVGEHKIQLALSKFYDIGSHPASMFIDGRIMFLGCIHILMAKGIRHKINIPRFLIKCRTKGTSKFMGGYFFDCGDKS